MRACELRRSTSVVRPIESAESTTRCIVVTPQNDLFRGEQSLEADYRNTSADEPCYQDPASPPATPS